LRWKSHFSPCASCFIVYV